MKIFLILSIAFSISGPLGAQISTQERIKHFNTENNLAIEGYDPVSYFHKGKAIKGSNKFLLKQMGITYYFSSASNRSAFEKSPQSYEPQYGGWCAYAMGEKGKKVEIDPKTFKIMDGKLYLFYNSFLNNTLNKWNEDEAKLKINADKNWQLLINK